MDTLKSSLNLAIDIGNSRCKWGLYSGSQLQRSDVWDFADIERLQGLVQQNGVQKAMLCSVADAAWTQELAYALSASCHTTVLSYATPIPLTNFYQTPETLGMDRLAAAIGAATLFRGLPLLVVDAGTCLTLDFVDAEANYLGGSIAPGIQMRLSAMHHFTQRLPKLQVRATPTTPGLTTEECMQSGAVAGFLFEIEGFVKHYQKAAGQPLHIVTTGGNGALVAEQIPLPAQITFEPNLTLIGLNEALRFSETSVAKN